MARKPPTANQPAVKSKSSQSQAEHMARRQDSGASVRTIADEFGMSKSTAHRKLGNVLRQGFTKIGDN